MGSLAVAAPFLLTVAQAAGYYVLLPMREAAWPWFQARFGEWASEWESLAWAVGELGTVFLATSVSAFVVGRLAGSVGLVGPFGGYWLANPLSAIGALVIFAALEPAIRTDFEHWTTLTWFTRVIAVVPIYAWCFQAGGRGGRTRG